MIWLVSKGASQSGNAPFSVLRMCLCLCFAFEILIAKRRKRAAG